MSERFQAYLEKLEGLSTEELDRSVVELVLREKEHVALVIAHIAEISRRKGDLERGYKNLFDYCVRRLNLSEGSVALRIQVANVARRFPQVLASLAGGRISLSVAGRLAPHLRDDNSARLLSECGGMTKREVEEYLVVLSPKPLFEPSIRRLPSGDGGSGKPRDEREESGEREETPRPRPHRAGLVEPARGNSPPCLPPEGANSPACSPPQGAEIYNFRFSAERGFKEKLDRLAEVLGIEDPVRSLATVLDRALDLALEKKDPRQRQERRLARERRRDERLAKPRPDEVVKEEEAREEAPAVASWSPESEREAAGKETVPARSRYIPLPVRERVLERAEYRCEFSGPDGTRCTSRTGLEIEHEMPFAIFRSHDERFLRAFCHQHNLLSAERKYGAEFIRGKIEEKKRRRAGLSLEFPHEPLVEFQAEDLFSYGNPSHAGCSSPTSLPCCSWGWRGL